MKRIIMCVTGIVLVLVLSGCQLFNNAAKVPETEPYSFGGITMDMPVGCQYTTQDDGIVTATYGEYPAIEGYYVFTKFDGKVDLITREKLQSDYMAMFVPEDYDTPEIKEFTETETDGYTKQIVRYDVVKDGITVNYIMDFIYLDDSMVMLSLGSPSMYDISGIEAVSDSVRVNK